MPVELAIDEALVQRLPLPLAQLYRRAHNAKTALERHQAAFYTWEAALKLLGSVAVVAYAEQTHHDAALAELLQKIARPALGHWWEFVRRLVPVLAETGDPGFQTLRDFLLGRSRDDLPGAAGLEAALREALEGRAGARASVRLSELFDRLVRYKNQEIGHGAVGQRTGGFYERMGQALLAGMAELLGRLDMLAGRRLLYVGDLRRLESGLWLIERYELVGEVARRLEGLELPTDGIAQLQPSRLYVDVGAIIGHRGIIECYDWGCDILGRREYPWYSMEFAPGGDLNSRLQERRARSPEGRIVWDDPAMRRQVSEEFRAIADAVAFLHEQHIVHRDIKPANVLIMDDGELRLSDFGLVKKVPGAGGQYTLNSVGPRSSDGALLGTLDYMAPEQARGEAVGKPADVYSLGIVLAELATGYWPRPNRQVPAGSLIENDDNRDRLDRLPERLRGLILWCTDQEPSNRPHNAREVLVEFEHVLTALTGDGEQDR